MRRLVSRNRRLNQNCDPDQQCFPHCSIGLQSHRLIHPPTEIMLQSENLSEDAHEALSSRKDDKIISSRYSCTDRNIVSFHVKKNLSNQREFDLGEAGGSNTFRNHLESFASTEKFFNHVMLPQKATSEIVDEQRLVGATENPDFANPTFEGKSVHVSNSVISGKHLEDLILNPAHNRSYRDSKILNSHSRATNSTSLNLENSSPDKVILCDDAESIYSDVTGLTELFVDSGRLSRSKQLTNAFESNVLCETRLLEETTKNAKKSVSFDKVSVRSYDRILSVNPSCSSGPPIGLGWNYSQENEFILDTFELHRQGRRKSKSQLVLSREMRERMLEELGYDRKALAQAVRQNIKAKNQRRRTVVNIGNAAFEETLESAKQGVKSIFVGTH